MIKRNFRENRMLISCGRKIACGCMVLCTALAGEALTAVQCHAATVIMGGDEVDDTGISGTQGATIYQSESDGVSEEQADSWTADGNTISDEGLSDKTIEYDELGTYIHKYNTTVQNAKTSINSTKNQYKQLKAFIHLYNLPV